jgi:hypothetical protein
LSQSVGVLSHERASSVLHLDHQLQGRNLIFKKVTELQFVVGQQTEFVRPVKLRDHLIGDVQQYLRREPYIAQIRQGAQLIFRDSRHSTIPTRVAPGGREDEDKGDPGTQTLLGTIGPTMTKVCAMACRGGIGSGVSQGGPRGTH